MKERIGFIGLGVMGSPMAHHLARSGYELTVNDIDKNATQSFRTEHANVSCVDKAADVAAHAEIIFTMLPDGGHVQNVVFGKHGLLEGMARGSVRTFTDVIRLIATVLRKV